MKATGWRKSGRSGDMGANCVEARRTDGWRKSSRSGNSGANCVEARLGDTGFQVRDSKLGETSPVFDLAASDFTSLLSAAQKTSR